MAKQEGSKAYCARSVGATAFVAALLVMTLSSVSWAQSSTSIN